MLKIFNGTQHAITIYSIEDTVSVQNGRKLVLKEGAAPILQLPPGINLNAVKGNSELPEHLRETEIPLKGGVRFLSYDSIPEGYDIVIVSNLYRSAVKELGHDTSKLATVNGLVYMSETEMRPCGCTALAVG